MSPAKLDSSARVQASSHHEKDIVEWSAVAIRLLQGVVYSDDNADLWEILCRNVSRLTDYFAKIGLQLITSEADGMAYLRQAEENEQTSEQEALPRLFRRSPLSYDATLLSVLLRDQLRQFEEEDLQNERLVISQAEFLETWQAFFPNEKDAVRLNKSLMATFRKLEELKFVRQFEKDPVSWEVRRIIKARLPLEDLETLRDSLVAAAELNRQAVPLENPNDETRELTDVKTE